MLGSILKNASKEAFFVLDFLRVVRYCKEIPQKLIRYLSLYMTKQPTNQDILDVLQAFASSVDSRFEKIESTMVTKEYLDDKLYDVKGEIANLSRKQDRKVEIIVKELVKRKIFDREIEARIMAV